MKRILLDTHALIWWFQGDSKLGTTAQANIASPTNQVYVSAASVWEMSIKRQMGKLKAPLDIEEKIEQAGFIKLPISLFHGQQAGALPPFHKDPFDRMLIAQAQAEGLQLMTRDTYFPEYGIKLIHASE
ncbi:MAG: type II toxin-antitoxin system VapC family toxin [Pseudomonadales bacterium]|nr:type II toxin-antitoxin system VapC family toxin [Pseudomonadales bacterium]